MREAKIKVLVTQMHFILLEVYLREKTKKYTFGIDGTDTFNTKLDYKRSLNGFDITFSSNYKLMSHIPEYGANIELSSAF